MSTTVEGKPEKSNNQASHSEQRDTAPQGQPALSNDWKRTFWYIGGAVAFLAITGIVRWSNRPAPITEFGKVGEEFYAQFDPTTATSLEVLVFDAKNLRPVDFRVARLANGRWVIPSHHNYPADAEQQLAKTAASIIGIKRGAMVTRWPADHARYGVVDPQQESLAVEEVEGVGQRLVLRKDDDSVLADFIIGKKIDGESGQYYVRQPKEDEVYITKLDINLSTKFTDWIKTDLFDFSNGEILRLTINDYSFDELTGSLTKGEVTTLTRDKTWSDDWKLDALDEATEQLNKDSIRDTTNAIADLKIVGVREKQKGLTPDLKLDPKSLNSQQGVDRLQQDLLSRGFLLQPGDADGTLRLISREGELFAGTDDGLVYRMYFGRVFTGSQEELEIGFTASDSGAKEGGTAESGGGDAGAANTTAAAATGDAADKSEGESKVESEGDESTSDEGKDTGNKPGRYLFVRIEFDKTMLGADPTKPVEPVKSAALVAAEEAEAAKPSATETKQEEATGAADATAEATDAKESELEKLRQEFQDAKDKYQDDLKAYDEFQTKVKDGQKKAEDLNRRFAEWYYVIPGESFDKLKLARADLVKPKEEKSATDEDNSSDAAVGNDAKDVEAESADELKATSEESELDAEQVDESEAADKAEATDGTDATDPIDSDSQEAQGEAGEADTGDTDDATDAEVPDDSEVDSP